VGYVRVSKKDVRDLKKKITKKRDVACEQALKGKYDGDSKRDVRNSKRWGKARKERYGVATISRLLKMIGLFCRI